VKILILSDGIIPESHGGAEVVTWNIAKTLAQIGEEVFIVTTTREKKSEGFKERKGVKIYTIYSAYHNRWRAYLSLRNPPVTKQVKEILNLLKPDVVHAHNIHNYLSYHCLKLAKKAGAKVFLTAHDVMLFHYGKLNEFINPNDLSFPKEFNYKVSPWQQIKKYKKRYNPFRNIIIKCYLKYVDKIFAVSKALKEALNQNNIDNVEVVHNGITIKEEVLNDQVAQFIIKNNLQGKKIVLFGGRLTKVKGGHQALLAMKLVAVKIPETVMLVLGEKNAYTNEMIEAARSLGLVQKLVFTGWLSGDELKAAYISSNVVIMPSICFDSFGMVCLEAMAYRKPVIATCFGGAKEIVLEDKTGYIVNSFDITLLANRILAILTDQSLADRLGQAGYLRAKEAFDLKHIAREYLSKYGNA